MRPFCLVLPLLALSAGAYAADPNAPHNNQGIVAAYHGAPAKVTLSAEDEAKLAAGQMVQKQGQTGNGGHAVAFMNINATPDKVCSILEAGMWHWTPSNWAKFPSLQHCTAPWWVAV